MCAAGFSSDLPEHFQIVRSAQNCVRQRADDDFGLGETGVQQNVALGNVAINGADTALAQAFVDERVEVHHGHFRNQCRLFPLDFLNQRAGSPRKTEQTDAFVLFVARGDEHGLVEVLQIHFI